MSVHWAHSVIDGMHALCDVSSIHSSFILVCRTDGGMVLHTTDEKFYLLTSPRMASRALCTLRALRQARAGAGKRESERGSAGEPSTCIKPINYIFIVIRV